jgi:hypothetical protein
VNDEKIEQEWTVFEQNMLQSKGRKGYADFLEEGAFLHSFFPPSLLLSLLFFFSFKGGDGTQGFADGRQAFYH